MTISRKTITPVRQATPRRSRAGFTAVEITAVATIIAILALVLIPILRNQVEESKLVAAQDDMASIEKAQMMAYSYVSRYIRLQDLTCMETNIQSGMTPNQIFNEWRKLPAATWDRVADSGTVNNYRENWGGPYLAIHRGKSVRDLISTNPVPFSHMDGPILYLEGIDEQDWEYYTGGGIDGEDGLDRAMHPVDPWGNPYIFFGPETGFNGRTTCVIYCMGPDGLPGTFGANVAENYLRQTGLLGTGDDLSREF